MDISEFTVEELQEEISQRKEKERLDNKPQQLENPDLTGLRSVLSEYIDSIYDGSYHEDSDINHYICKEAVKAIYGKSVFDWISQNTD